MRRVFIFVSIAMAAVSCNDVAEPAPASPGGEKQLQELANKYPDSLLLKENLVEYFRQNGDYEKALQETEKALQQDSLNAHLLSVKATLFFEAGDTSKAIATFEKAVAINPQPEYIRLLGSLYAQTSNINALAMANALLRVPGLTNVKESFFIKGLYYNYAGEKLKAISFLDSCLKFDYRYTLAYREKAICLYDLGKYEDALKVLRQAIAIQDNFEEAYYWMGRCYEKMDNKKQAADNYHQALQLDSNYVEAKEALDKLK